MTCVWRYQLNIQVWKGDCGIMANVALISKLLGAAEFNYCPQCGNKMEMILP